jgi:hypothetical protein
MEFQNHDVTRMIATLFGLSLEVRKCRGHKMTKTRYGSIHSVRSLACNFEIIRQNSSAIDGAKEMIQEMQEFIKFSEYNIVNDHC